MTRLSLEHLADYSDKGLIAEIRRVSALVPGPVYGVRQFKARARCSYQVVWLRFGSWKNALRRAGLTHRAGTYRLTPGLKLRLSRRMSEDDLLGELRRVAKAKGTDKVKTSDLALHDAPPFDLYARRFGTWQAALDRAGLKPCGTGRRYTDAQCLENLRVLWVEYGRQPRECELRRDPSTVSLAAYVRRWGSWRGALQAFVDQVNATPGDPLLALTRPWAERVAERQAARAAPTAGAIQGASAKAAPAPVEQRSPGSVLRYLVLKRDRFRCVLCGASPATDPAVELHIDHVQPYSQGGATTASNLRVLCRDCNLGRGPHPYARRRAGKG